MINRGDEGVTSQPGYTLSKPSNCPNNRDHFNRRPEGGGKVNARKESSAERLDAWIRLYEEESRCARQHESLRSKSANLIGAATGAVLALLASNAVPLDEQRGPAAILAIFVLAINLLGLLTSRKHYERTRRHQTIAGAYRKVISANCQMGSLDSEATRDQANARHNKKEEFRVRANEVSLHTLWEAIHVVFIVLGLCLMFYICLN